LNLDKPEKTARVSQRRKPHAKQTTTKVDSVPNKTALPSQHAHHNSAQVEALLVVLELLADMHDE
jgi:hypothetical protein